MFFGEEILVVVFFCGLGFWEYKGIGYLDGVYGDEEFSSVFFVWV